VTAFASARSLVELGKLGVVVALRELPVSACGTWEYDGIWGEDWAMAVYVDMVRHMLLLYIPCCMRGST
jgi:hypothetical protein